MMRVRLRHFGIVVRDLDQALGFYRDLLGFVEVRRMHERGPFIEAINGMPSAEVTTIKLEAEPGGVQIELLQFHSHQDTHPRPPEPYYIGPTHFALTVDNVDALYGRLSSQGVAFTTRPRISDDGKAKVTFCRDPASGTLIELVEML